MATTGASGGPGPAPTVTVQASMAPLSQVASTGTVSVATVGPGTGTASGAALAAMASALPWPATGQAALSVPAVGYTAASGPEQAVPVASLTKLVTAYVVLRDHPLAVGDDGPEVTITDADAADYANDVVTDQSSVLLAAGEQLSEYQLLEGLLVHSANDFADTLAAWDAGSVAAFVTEMNAAAVSLGMTASHFADASGYDPSSVSTAADLLKAAALDMAQPAFAQIVAMTSATLPLSGRISTYTPLLGTPGVVGVKSGFTSAAGGGDVLAFQAPVGSGTVTVLAAVTSQEGPEVLDRAGHEALAVAQAVAAHLVPVTVAAAGRQVGRASAAERRVPVVEAGDAELVALPGQAVHQHVTVAHHLGTTARAGAKVGTATFTLGNQRVTVPLRTKAALGTSGGHRRLS